MLLRDPLVELLPQKGEKSLIIEVLNSWRTESYDLDFLKLFMGAVKARYGREEESRVLNYPDKSGRTPLMAAVNSRSDGSGTLEASKNLLPFL